VYHSTSRPLRSTTHQQDDRHDTQQEDKALGHIGAQKEQKKSNKEEQPEERPNKMAK
jgi:hypothetical protein